MGETLTRWRIRFVNDKGEETEQWALKGGCSFNVKPSTRKKQ